MTLLYASFFVAVQSSSPEFDVRIEAWHARVSGSMKFDEKPAVGDRVDLRGDLGAGSEIMPALKAAVSAGDNRFSIGALRIRWESEETLDRDRRWNESSFPAGEEVRTRFDLFEGDLAWQRRVVGTEGLDLWAGLAARYLRLEAVLNSPSQGRDDDHTITFAPAARLGGRWIAGSNIGLRAGLEVTYLDTSEMEVRGMAGAVAAEWSPGKSLSLSVGWRTESLRMTKDNSLERNDLRFHGDGVHAGVQFHF